MDSQIPREIFHEHAYDKYNDNYSEHFDLYDDIQMDQGNLQDYSGPSSGGYYPDEILSDIELSSVGPILSAQSEAQLSVPFPPAPGQSISPRDLHDFQASASLDDGYHVKPSEAPSLEVFHRCQWMNCSKSYKRPSDLK